MKTKIKNKVLNFMENFQTEKLNTNNFIINFLQFSYGNVNIELIQKGPSFESIARSRRYWISHREDLKRSNESKDNENKYQEEFQKVPTGIN